MSKLLFSTIDVTRQAFYRTPFAFAIVNLKPIVPGHVLVVPTRPAPRLADLAPHEIAELFAGVQHVGRIVERAYVADALTIACQDGRAAGQSVPHVHIHILPRRSKGDYFEGRNDEIYPAIERAEAKLPDHLVLLPSSKNTVESAKIEQKVERKSQPLRVDAEENRTPRSEEDMWQEATWLKELSDAERNKRVE
ncbi:HIT-like protein [Rickenella mellea]|uniref:HIT-like protein n=1 Tax=Rickenella mellea TaxID=50990 RepID=A0A4Y7QK59_9AGAM|nr:HIT-like protein [Rickenella mellea]